MTALGSNWKTCATEPAGVQGFAQEAAAAGGARDEGAAAEGNPAARPEEVIGEALFPAAEGLPESSPPAAARPGAAGPRAVSREGSCHLLSLELEAVGEACSAREKG
eukprot:864821-Pyramimonas_sp.AAC.1